MLHTSTLYLIESQIAPAEEIAALAPFDDAKVFTTSGIEATEAALLLACTARRSNQILVMLTPDVLTFAKGLGNGLGLAGVVVPGELMDGIDANSISTFGGNPLATAGGLANLRYLLAHGLQERAHKRGQQLRARLVDGLDGAEEVDEAADVLVAALGRVGG